MGYAYHDWNGLQAATRGIVSETQPMHRAGPEPARVRTARCMVPSRSPRRPVADAILDEMLQAQIDIVDEAGQTEESVTILGPGRVSLGMRPSGGYLHVDEAAPDLAVITQDGGLLSIDVKVAGSLQRDNNFIAKGSLSLSFAPHALVAYILQLRRYVKVKQTVVNGELMSGGAVIHSTSSSLLDRARVAIAQGSVEVARELQELRDQGKIDELGNILVPLPDDMKPDSSTDL
jgi:hypothetical protein